MLYEDHTVVLAERLDQLAGRLYGATNGIVEQILDANRGLAAEGLRLTVGRVISIPVAESTAADVEVVRLWT